MHNITLFVLRRTNLSFSFLIFIAFHWPRSVKKRSSDYEVIDGDESTDIFIVLRF